MNYSELKEKLKDVPVPLFVQDQEPDQASYIDKDYVSKVFEQPNLDKSLTNF